MSEQYKNIMIKKNVNTILLGVEIVVGVILFMIFIASPFIQRSYDAERLPYKQNLAYAEEKYMRDLKTFNVYGQGFDDSEYDGHNCWIHNYVIMSNGNGHSEQLSMTDPKILAWKKEHPDLANTLSGSRLCMSNWEGLVKEHQNTLNEITAIQKELAK